MQILIDTYNRLQENTEVLFERDYPMEAYTESSLQIEYTEGKLNAEFRIEAESAVRVAKEEVTEALEMHIENYLEDAPFNFEVSFRFANSAEYDYLSNKNIKLIWTVKFTQK